MKSLSLHIDQLTTYIAIKDLENFKLTKLITASNISLFKHPELLPERLYNLVENNIETQNPKFEDIEFCLPGNIENFSNDFFTSPFLDYISYTRSYDGYNFDSHFAKYFSPSSVLNKVLLKGHFNTFAKKISSIPSFETPSILILLHIDSKIGFVHQSGDVKLLDIKFNNEKDDKNSDISENLSLDSFVGDEGIFNVLNQKTFHVSETYSIRIKNVIKETAEIAELNKFKYKSIIIVSSNYNLINSQIIKSSAESCPIHILRPDINFAIACCGLYPAAYFKDDKEIKENLSELILAM